MLLAVRPSTRDKYTQISPTRNSRRVSFISNDFKNSTPDTTPPRSDVFPTPFPRDFTLPSHHRVACRIQSQPLIRPPPESRVSSASPSAHEPARTYGWRRTRPGLRRRLHMASRARTSCDAGDPVSVVIRIRPDIPSRIATQTTRVASPSAHGQSRPCKSRRKRLGFRRRLHMIRST